MTPSQQAKALGLKSLAQVRDMLGTNKNGHPMVSLQTLGNWHKNKPELFKAVCIGCVEIIRRDQNDGPASQSIASLDDLKAALSEYHYIAVHGGDGAMKIAKETASLNDCLVVPDVPESGMVDAAGEYIMSTGGFSKNNWTFFGIYRAMTQASQTASEVIYQNRRFR